MPLTLTREDFMTPEQVRRLKGVLRRASEEALRRGKKGPVRDWAILHVALDAGLRVSEIISLRVGDLRTPWGSQPTPRPFCSCPQGEGR